MKKSIDGVEEIFSRDMKKELNPWLFYISGFFLLFGSACFSLGIWVGIMPGCFGILFLIWGLRRERIFNSYIVLTMSIFFLLILVIVTAVALLIPLVGLGVALLIFLYPYLDRVDEIREGEWERLNHIKGEYADYFNNLSYSDIKEKIEELKKGVVVVDCLIKLTEEGYKKLMFAVETIKEHKLEIYTPIEPTISTVTPISSIEEVGKYAECPYCSSNIRETFYELGGVVRCDKCGALHHKECFEYYGRKCGSSSCKLREA